MAEAQREIADDWLAAYARYVGGRPLGAPDLGRVAIVAPAARPTVKASLEAEALRLVPHWIHGVE